MKSISSSYEVEMSDDDSCTNCSVNEDYSYSTTEEDHKSASCVTLSSGVYTSDTTSRNHLSLYNSSSEYTDYEYDTDTTNGNDQISTLPEQNFKTPYNPKRTTSEFSACSAKSNNSISSSVSNFLNAVDKTVDVVVDALLPMEDGVAIQKEHGMKRALSFNKRLSFTKRDTDNESVASRRSLGDSVFSRRSLGESVFSKRSASIRGTDVGKGNEGSNKMKNIFKKSVVNDGEKSNDKKSFFKKSIDNNNDKDTGKKKRSFLKRGSRKKKDDNMSDAGTSSAFSLGSLNLINYNNESTKKQARDDSDVGLRSPFGLGFKKKDDSSKQQTKEAVNKPRFQFGKQSRKDENSTKSSSSKKSFRFNRKKEEEQHAKEEENVYDLLKSLFVPDLGTSSEEEAIQDKRNMFQFRKNAKNKSDMRMSTRKKKGYGFMTNE